MVSTLFAEAFSFVARGNGLKFGLRVKPVATITLKSIPCSAGWFAGRFAADF